MARRVIKRQSIRFTVVCGFVLYDARSPGLLEQSSSCSGAQEGRNLPRRIAPDIMVSRSLAVPDDPGSLAVALYGPPALVIKVASPGTALGNDVNLRDQSAKPQLYEQIGVDEYLVYNPVGEMLGERIWTGVAQGRTDG